MSVVLKSKVCVVETKSKNIVIYESPYQRIKISFNEKVCLRINSYWQLTSIYKNDIKQRAKQHAMESIISENKVHFFEYMQIQILQDYIRKGIKYFLNALSDSHPKLIGLRYWADELTALLDLLKDIICLGRYHALYAEQFYGLQRATFKAQSNLPKLKVVWQACVHTLIPYLLKKIETYYNVLTEEVQNEGRSLNTAQKAFTSIYPYLYMAMTLVQTSFKFRYLLFEDVKFYDFYYKMSRSTLSYPEMPSGSGEQLSKVTYPWQDLFKSPGLLIVLLGHKGLTWYFNMKNQRGKTGQKKSLGKNVVQMKDRRPMDSGNRVNRQEQQNSGAKKGMCLICAKKMSNPTVVKESGYVYCFDCISSYVSENRKCPMSSIEVDQDSLQLIYS